MSKHRVAVISGLASLTLGLAACGSATLNGQQQAGQAATPEASVLSAMTQTKSSSYRFAMKIDIGGLGGISALGGTGTGSAPSSLSVSGQGAFSAPQEALEMTISIPGLSSLGATSGIDEILFVRTGKMYMSIPGLSGSAKWYSLDLGSLVKDDAGLSSLGDGPADYLSTVSGAIVSARKIGSAEIDGVATTEYALTENLQAVMKKELGSGEMSALLKELSASSGLGSAGSEMTNALTTALAALPKYMTSDVWLDSAGHLRKLYVSLPMGQVMSALFSTIAKSAPAGVTGLSGSSLAMLKNAFAGFSESVTMVFTDLGGTVDISAPPASEITAGNPFSALAGGSAAVTGSGVAS